MYISYIMITPPRLQINQYKKFPVIQPTILGVSIVYLTLLTYWTIRLPFSRQRLTVIFVGAALSIWYLLEISKVIKQKPVIDDWRDWWTFLVPLIGFILSVILSIIVYIDYNAMKTVRVGYMSTLDLVVGSLIILLVLYASFREYGKAFGSVVIVFILYAHLGSLFPGVFRHSGFELTSIVRFSTVGLTTGVWTTGISGVIATWVAVFVIFAGFLEGFGGMQWMKDIGQRITLYVSSGTAQTAVITSMGFGMISGSGAANTAITGSFTIPLMKETQNIRGKYAAALESVASTGGQITPPVMGAAAFLMADLLGVSLATIIVVAALPAALFYVPLVITAHLVGTGEKWRRPSGITADVGECDEKRMVASPDNPESTNDSPSSPTDANPSDKIDTEAVPSGKSLLLEGLPYYLPIALLVYLLVSVGLGVMRTGIYSILAAIGCGVIAVTYRTGLKREAVYESITSMADGLISGMETSAKIGVIGAAIGIVVAVIDITAIAQRVGLVLLEISGGNFELLLLLTAGLAIVLGMGAPPVAAYLITVLILAPAIIDFGVPELQAHFFVFYFAILSYITPPIAIGVAIASNLADSDFMVSCKEAVKMGLPLYVLPFTFIYFDLISETSSWLEVFPRFLYILVALSLLPFAFYSSLSRVYRVVLLAISFGMLVGWIILI